MTEQATGTSDEHLQARLRLLAAEKEHTRRGDELAAMRRSLPWVRIDKQYLFDTSEGERTTADISEGDRAAARHREPGDRKRGDASRHHALAVERRRS